MLEIPAASPGEFALVAAGGGLLVLVLARVLALVGFTGFETVLLGVSPLLSGADADVFRMGETVISVDAAGFVVPFLVSVKVVIEGRAPVLGTAIALAAVSGTAFLESYADPGRGILLRYQGPAIVAGLGAILVVRDKLHAAGPVAYACGAMGVAIGADAFRLAELTTPGVTERVVVGGAGVLDGIVIVAVVATAFTLVARGLAAVTRLVDPATVVSPDP